MNNIVTKIYILIYKYKYKYKYIRNEFTNIF